ncbi:hypothetical protein OIDMADRAFT_173193 [Oidiodendron maius Zn]|uniref:Zn(2)-C6 fungal-type domain-containing protein n=1 Tax=Oidiodendron maius (strain Zn) TaxID=913774 RepID=A0A0C3GB49_OIDMZ|nr:hypothetical protein OIDMADRAFT_173193 [Oidiodendron maius Zn]
MPTRRARTVKGSCWGCRERRVKCDLSSPTCGKCANTSRACDYSKVRLRWTDSIASRGRLGGKKIPLYHPPSLQKNHNYDLLYFESELLPRFTLSNIVPRGLDLVALSRDPILVQSIVAVGTAHQATRSSQADAALSSSKNQDRHSAIRIFRKNLVGTHTDEVNNSLFLANVLLCILDGIIEQPTTEDSATHNHILGGKAILNHWGGVHRIFQLKNDLPIFMLSIFATMDLTHAILIGEEPYLKASSWAEFGSCNPWWGTVNPNDDFLETMAIFSQLATLGHGVRHLNKTVPIGVLLSAHMALRQQARRRTDCKDDKHETLRWASFCSVYRFAASIYLYRALSGLGVGHLLVQQAVASCMEIIGSTMLTAQLHHCILFPLLIVGSHCMLEEQRLKVRRSLRCTARYLSFRSVHSLDCFLGELWVKMDETPECRESSWWEYFDEIAKVTCIF